MDIEDSHKLKILSYAETEHLLLSFFDEDIQQKIRQRIIDDYFNCLTVGTVMRPVTDKFKIARTKLAYIIDATAAPVCIIAPVSSWAAAVGSSLPEDATIDGFTLFLQTIPFNLYAWLTLVFMIYIIWTWRSA